MPNSNLEGYKAISLSLEIAFPQEVDNVIGIYTLRGPTTHYTISGITSLNAIIIGIGSNEAIKGLSGLTKTILTIRE